MREITSTLTRGLLIQSSFPPRKKRSARVTPFNNARERAGSGSVGSSWQYALEYHSRLAGRRLHISVVIK